LITNGNRFKNPPRIANYTLEDNVMSRQENQTLVLQPYKENKTIREIAKEAKMSFRDIDAILKNTSVEENENKLGF
jgi:hypothetical protein